MSRACPRWAFELWCLGAGDRICAADYDLPIDKARRVFWCIRGTALQWLFGWWEWENEQYPEVAR